MADFEHYHGTASNIALEIERKLIALGLDWQDSAAMYQLANEALASDSHASFAGLHTASPEDLARIQLFGLIGLMLRTMEEGADSGQEIHGSEVWKSLAKALWAAKEAGGTSERVSRET
jgi:hypothetical protein